MNVFTSLGAGPGGRGAGAPRLRSRARIHFGCAPNVQRHRALGLLLLLCIFTAGVTHAGATGRTTLVLTNNTNQVTQVGLILAALGGACPSDHPPVTADQLAKLGFCHTVTESGNPPYAGKCLLTIGKKSSVTFPDIPKTCISGNITFGGYAACPGGNFPTGTTTAEFTLNPLPGSVEAIDISLVNGYSGTVTMSTSGGGGWAYGPNSTAISTISNKALGQNVGNPGVYPENCTDCIQLVGQPVCPGFSSNPVCQKARICNVQRSTSGGSVTITLNP